MSGAVVEAPTPAPAPVAPVTPVATPAPAAVAPVPPVAPGEPAKAIEAPKGAPEKYADFTLPEGAAPDPKLMEGFTGIAKAQNLTQEQAQALVDFHAGSVKSMVSAHQAEVDSWPAKIAADKELGGADSPAKVAAAQRAIEMFGTPELKAFLDTYQLGTHPEMVRFCWKIGQKIKEDSVAGTQGASADAPTDFATDFYRRAVKPNEKKTA